MRYRITFSKNDEMRFTGHLDLHRTWERTFRRAGLPIAYSQGFHPQPRINLAAALPLGFTSECELADVWLESEVPVPQVLESLNAAAPPGLVITHIEPIDQRVPPLQTQVVATEYLVTLLDPVQDLDSRITSVVDSKSLLRERRGKQYDLRPLILDMHRLPDDEHSRSCIFMRLTAEAGATGRPEEILYQMDILPEAAKVHRKRIIFKEQM